MTMEYESSNNGDNQQVSDPHCSLLDVSDNHHGEEEEDSPPPPALDNYGAKKKDKVVKKKKKKRRGRWARTKSGSGGPSQQQSPKKVSATNITSRCSICHHDLPQEIPSFTLSQDKIESVKSLIKFLHPGTNANANSNATTTSPSSSSGISRTFCLSCHTALTRVISLKQQVSTLEEELMTEVEKINAIISLAEKKLREGLDPSMPTLQPATMQLQSQDSQGQETKTKQDKSKDGCEEQINSVDEDKPEKLCCDGDVDNPMKSEEPERPESMVHPVSPFYIDNNPPQIKVDAEIMLEIPFEQKFCGHQEIQNDGTPTENLITPLSEKEPSFMGQTVMDLEEEDELPDDVTQIILDNSPEGNLVTVEELRETLQQCLPHNLDIEISIGADGSPLPDQQQATQDSSFTKDIGMLSLPPSPVPLSFTPLQSSFALPINLEPSCYSCPSTSTATNGTISPQPQPQEILFTSFSLGLVGEPKENDDVPPQIAIASEKVEISSPTLPRLESFIPLPTCDILSQGMDAVLQTSGRQKRASRLNAERLIHSWTSTDTRSDKIKIKKVDINDHDYQHDAHWTEYLKNNRPVGEAMNDEISAITNSSSDNMHPDMNVLLSNNEESGVAEVRPPSVTRKRPRRLNIQKHSESKDFLLDPAEDFFDTLNEKEVDELVIKAVCVEGFDKVKCPKCTSVFKNRHRLRRHLVDCHTRKKRFPCDQCGRMFKHRHHLQEHSRLHTGEKPFACDRCGRKFSHSGSYSSHRNTGSCAFMRGINKENQRGKGNRILPKPTTPSVSEEIVEMAQNQIHSGVPHSDVGPNEPSRRSPQQLREEGEEVRIILEKNGDSSIAKKRGRPHKKDKAKKRKSKSPKKGAPGVWPVTQGDLRSADLTPEELKRVCMASFLSAEFHQNKTPSLKLENGRKSPSSLTGLDDQFLKSLLQLPQSAANMLSSGIGSITCAPAIIQSQNSVVSGILSNTNTTLPPRPVPPMESHHPMVADSQAHSVTSSTPGDFGISTSMAILEETASDMQIPAGINVVENLPLPVPTVVSSAPNTHVSTSDPCLYLDQSNFGPLENSSFPDFSASSENTTESVSDLVQTTQLQERDYGNSSHTAGDFANSQSRPNEIEASQLTSGAKSKPQKRSQKNSSLPEKGTRRNQFRQRTLSCPKCPTLFTLRTNLIRHGRLKHGLDWVTPRKNNVSPNPSKKQEKEEKKSIKKKERSGRRVSPSSSTSNSSAGPPFTLVAPRNPSAEMVEIEALLTTKKPDPHNPQNFITTDDLHEVFKEMEFQQSPVNVGFPSQGTTPTSSNYYWQPSVPPVTIQRGNMSADTGPSRNTLQSITSSSSSSSGTEPIYAECTNVFNRYITEEKLIGSDNSGGIVQYLNSNAHAVIGQQSTHHHHHHHQLTTFDGDGIKRDVESDSCTTSTPTEAIVSAMFCMDSLTPEMFE